MARFKDAMARGGSGQKAMVIASIVLGVIYALSYYGRVAIDKYTAHKLFGEIGALFVSIVLALIVFSGICFLLLGLCVRRKQEEGSRRLPGFLMTRKGLFAMAAALMVLWLPYIISMYPFDLGADTMAQLIWSQGFPAFDPSSKALLPGYAMSDHHPFALTLLYGAFYDLGSLVGRPTWGITLLCLLQAALMALVFAHSCRWMRRRGVPDAVCVAAFLFWGLNPAIPMLLMQLVKDISAVPFFLLFCLGFADAASDLRSSGSVPARRLLALVAVAVLGGLARKIFVYVTGGSLVVLALWHLASSRRAGRAGSARPAAGVVAAAAAPFLVVSVLVPAALFPALRVAPGGPQEMLSVPIQQVSAVVTSHPERLSAEDMAVVSAVLPVDELPTLYTPSSADPVKDAWDRGSTGADRARFLLLWLRLMPGNLPTYVRSVLYMSDFWFVGSIVNDRPLVWWGWHERGGSELFPGYAEYEVTPRQQAVGTFYFDYLANMPVVRFLCYTAFYQLWLPCFAIVLAKLRGLRNWVMFTPVVLSILTCLLVAAYQPRYAFFELFAAPIVLALGFLGGSERDSGHSVTSQEAC